MDSFASVFPDDGVTGDDPVAACGRTPLPPCDEQADATTSSTAARDRKRFTSTSYCTVIAAVETVTDTLVLSPDESLTVIEHVPAAIGAT